MMNTHAMGYHVVRTLRRYLGVNYVLWNPSVSVGIGSWRELPRKYCTNKLNICKDLFYLNSQNLLVTCCKKRLKVSLRCFSVDQTGNENGKTSLKQGCAAGNEDPSLEPPSSVGVRDSRVRKLVRTPTTHHNPESEFEKVAGDDSSRGQQTHEQFYELLLKCSSPSDVLDLAGKSNLNPHQLSNCFTVMWDTIKKMSEEKRWYEKKIMFEHPVFEQLCVKAMQEARGMQCDDLAYTMLALVKLGTSTHSRLIQMLLRVSQEKLNNFHERALSVLASCLEEMESSKNVDALRAGLRILIELRVARIKGVLPLQTLMRAAGSDASPALKKKFEAKALSMMDQFSLPNTQYMFTTLAAINLRSFPILKACSDKIVGIHHLNSDVKADQQVNRLRGYFRYKDINVSPY
ncbi:FAST kinase domain-containing protein 2, mitochondrial-like [Protopterus annectens]|uniref:FAST kinase domain-containing protein 2, mitochondrial-like n=1 Tax=Protopterus annectens TaxID=7888 RepID=UPI001CFBF6A9|nr:FAST kinase domain-containing protein 2, mitochondrial-like [Protopterus annectens]